MDEKMNSVLKDIYDSLTDVQKEKAKNIKSLEELTEFASKEGIELPDDLLNEVDGGGGEWHRSCSHTYCGTKEC